MNDSIKVLVLRFFELFLTNVIISASLTLLDKMGFFGTRGSLTFALFLGAIAFFVINIRMLRNCYFSMGRYHKEYYLLNTVAYLLFAILNFIVYANCSNEVYAWLFSITKLIRFTTNGVDIYISALFFHFLGLAAVFFSPAGVVVE